MRKKIGDSFESKKVSMIAVDSFEKLRLNFSKLSSDRASKPTLWSSFFRLG